MCPITTPTSEREPLCTTHSARRTDMAFFQMDDGFDSEPRVLQAATAAFGLYSRCGIWAARNGTDGFVSEHIAALYGTREWIERLVDSGLWVRVDGGFTMPDYLEIHGNWPAEKIRAHRAAAAERQARARARKATPVLEDTSRRESRVTHTGSHAVSHSAPSHTHPIDLLPSEGEEPAAAPPDASERGDVERLCQHLAARIAEDGSKHPSIGKAWRDAARLMIDKDGYTEDQVKRAIDFAHDDEFWRTNILSMPTLRRQYTALRKSAQRAQNRALATTTARPEDLGGDEHMQRFLARQAARRSA